MQPIDEVVRSYLAAGDAADYAALADLLHDDLVTHSPGGATTFGVADNVAAWRTAHDGLDRLGHRVLSMVTAGETVAARVLVTGIHAGHFLGVPPTGAHLRVDQALFARLSGGRIVELWEIVDTGSGLQQIGVLGDQDLGPAPG
ncbi:ester cyclase [Nocardioides panacisoli]|uniref:ester cyclase n=1 Tax=Nocardioides panacisoli TaxID=627624 RepID=UPI001C629437|nr:ester cyclase [Nocardioides panacisoli]QYJ05284.1 ester cyclase [Nocardioides panacisoli]